MRVACNLMMMKMGAKRHHMKALEVQKWMMLLILKQGVAV